MLKFGLMTKIGARGGSEMRSAEILNMFTKDFEVHLFAEDKVNPEIRNQLLPVIQIHERSVHDPAQYHQLEKMDILLVVNSDSYSFSKIEYWEGKAKKKDGELHHNSYINLSGIGKIGFLYNFVITPAKKLGTIHAVNPRVVLISTNKFFIDEINTKDGKGENDKKFKVLHDCGIPCYTINSPINIAKFDITRTPMGSIVHIGRHSLPYDSKFHPKNVDLVKSLLAKFRGKVKVDHMGVPGEYDEAFKDPDITIREKFSMPVPEYLKNIDIFLYYTKWERREPWPRVTAEAMMAGCCVVTNGIYGMKEQIENGFDGFLAYDDNDFIMKVVYLIEHPEIIEEVGARAKEKAKKEFSSEAVYERMKEVLMP